jgi:hypothetical protein
MRPNPFIERMRGKLCLSGEFQRAEAMKNWTLVRVVLYLRAFSEQADSCLGENHRSPVVHSCRLYNSSFSVSLACCSLSVYGP